MGLRPYSRYDQQLWSYSFNEWLKKEDLLEYDIHLQPVLLITDTLFPQNIFGGTFYEPSKNHQNLVAQCVIEKLILLLGLVFLLSSLTL